MSQLVVIQPAEGRVRVHLRHACSGDTGLGASLLVYFAETFTSFPYGPQTPHWTGWSNDSTGNLDPTHCSYCLQLDWHILLLHSLGWPQAARVQCSSWTVLQGSPVPGQA